MTNPLKEKIAELVLGRFIEKKGWHHFKDDILAYGGIVTDKEGNRVDPEKLQNITETLNDIDDIQKTKADTREWLEEQREERGEY